MTKVTFNFDKTGAVQRFTDRIKNKVQPILDGQVLKDSNYYAPQREGFLRASAILNSKLGTGVLIWATPYARRQYYDFEKKSTDKNPNARTKWFEEAKAVKQEDWIKLSNKVFE